MIRLVIQHYICSKERLLTAEGLNFSVIQSVWESDNDFCAPKRRSTLLWHTERSLRDTEAKLILLDGIKNKPTMTHSELTERLQFRSQATVYASSSTDNRLVLAKPEWKTFRNPSENFTGNKGNSHLCNRCRVRPHGSKPGPAMNKKRYTCENGTPVGFFQKCAEVKLSVGQVRLTGTTSSVRKRLSCLAKHLPKWIWDCIIHAKTCLTCQRPGSTLL